MLRAVQWQGRQGDQPRHEQSSAPGAAASDSSQTAMCCELAKQEIRGVMGARERERLRVEVRMVEVRASAPLLARGGLSSGLPDS